MIVVHPYPFDHTAGEVMVPRRMIPGDWWFSAAEPWGEDYPAIGDTFRSGFMDDTGTLWMTHYRMGIWNTSHEDWPTYAGVGVYGAKHWCE